MEGCQTPRLQLSSSPIDPRCWLLLYDSKGKLAAGAPNPARRAPIRQRGAPTILLVLPLLPDPIKGPHACSFPPTSQKAEQCLCLPQSRDLRSTRGSVSNRPILQVEAGKARAQTASFSTQRSLGKKKISSGRPSDQCPPDPDPGRRALERTGRAPWRSRVPGPARCLLPPPALPALRTYAAGSSSPSLSSSVGGISWPGSRAEGAAAAAGARAGAGGARAPHRRRPQGPGCRDATAGRAAGGSRCAAARSPQHCRRPRGLPGRAGPSAQIARCERPWQRLAGRCAGPASGGLAGGHSRASLFPRILPAASDSAAAEPAPGDGELGAPPLLPPSPPAPPRPAPRARALRRRPEACSPRARNRGAQRHPSGGPRSPPPPDPGALRLQTRLPHFPDLSPLLSMPSPARRRRHRRLSTWGLKFSGSSKKG